MVVVVADAVFEARRRPGGLNAPDEAFGDQEAKASYTDWSEMAPISALTTSATPSAVMWGCPATARKTANRWAVTWMPR